VPQKRVAAMNASCAGVLHGIGPFGERGFARAVSIECRQVSVDATRRGWRMYGHDRAAPRWVWCSRDLAALMTISTAWPFFRHRLSNASQCGRMCLTDCG